jgi:hypothetical protein
MALSWLEMAYGEPGSTGAAWCYLLPMYGAQVCSLWLEGRAHSESVQRRRPPRITVLFGRVAASRELRKPRYRLYLTGRERENDGKKSVPGATGSCRQCPSRCKHH